MFSQPSAGSDFKAADHVGHLLLIYVRELREGIVTQYGTSEAIGCDLVVLTDQKGPRPETQVLLFQKPLIGSLRQNIGKDPVLARLGQGTAKPGQSAPYILNPFDEQDKAFAEQYLHSVGGNPFQAAPNFQPPAPAPVPAVPLPTAAPQAAYPPAYPPAYPAAPQAPFPAAPGSGVGVPAAAAPVAQQYPAPQAPQVPQQQYAPAPVPAQAPAPQHLVQLPNGQMGTPEQAAAIQALGMNGMPPAAPAQ